MSHRSDTYRAGGPTSVFGAMMSRVMSTKKQIIEGAFGALLSDGLPNLSYDRIAQAAGTSRQLVRYHFRDPDALMVSVCDRLAAAYRETILAGAAKATPDGERLSMLLDFLFDMAEGRDKPRDEQVYDALMARTATSPRVRGALREQSGLLGRVVAHEVRVAHPQLDEAQAGEISYVVVALFYGHWRMVGSLGFSEAHKVVAREAVARVIAAHLADGAAPLMDGPAWSLDTEAA